ncbi:MAG: ABC transporter substrate-binding protein [Proteobacteria bacterium]|nr:ABC transporter substrate-binding protein [Pseudomonadota bacterium]
MSHDKKLNILIVDDSGTMRLMFKQMLTKAGYENFVMAVDGKDGIKKLEENQIDIVISDWNMPNMDGMELLQWIRRDERFKMIPFIMATAQGDKSQQEKVRVNGGNNHIAKPFDDVEIAQKIHEVFDVKPSGDEEVQPREREIRDGKVVLKLAHIQITDHLALGIMKHLIEAGELNPEHFELETQRMPGWNPLQEVLEKGEVDGAFVLAPIAMDLFAFDTPIKLVALAHRNGSSFVRNVNYTAALYDNLKSFYKYKVVNIPHKMSIHNIMAHRYLTSLGLRPGVPGKKAIDVRFEVVPPVKMPMIMKENDDVAGFVVAEPIASNAIAKNIAELDFVTSNMWKGHPCCVASFRDEFIEEFPDAVYEFTKLLVHCGMYVEKNIEKAAEIAVAFLDPDKKIGLTTEVLHKVLSDPEGITMDNLYPALEDLDTMQRYMVEEMGIGVMIDVEEFADLRFIEAALNK